MDKSAMLEDKLLVWKIKRGDKEALRVLYEKYKDDLLTIAVSLINDACTAEDILHDVFVNFVKSLGRFELYGSLKGYFVTCAVNEVRDKLRKEMYKVVGLDSIGPLVSDSEEADKSASESEQSDRLMVALREVPLQQREVIILHLQGGMKFREIANIQCVSINTVQSRYQYGLDKLRSFMNEEVIE